MESKTDFEVFVEMNKNDVKNNTSTIGACYQWRNANKAKNGAVIEMGMPEVELYNIMNGERIPVLLLINKDAFFKIKNEGKQSKDAAVQECDATKLNSSNKS